jgi:hypothetical protein
MVASISSSTSSVSKWADSVFSNLDTKNQGYIEKIDLQSALSAADDSGNTQSSELTDAMTKLSDQLDAQFDASRMSGGGGMRPDGPPPGPPPESAGGTSNAHHQRDPMRAFAHALQLLTAYSDNGGGTPSSSGSSTSSSRISVEA